MAPSCASPGARVTRRIPSSGGASETILATVTSGGGERDDALERRVDLDEPVGALVGVMHPLDVAPGSGADPAPLLGGRGELGDAIAERLLRDRDDRHAGAECALGLLDGLGPEVAQDGLAERHRLQREDPVPAGIELVDHDVGAPEPAPRLVMAQPFDDVELDVEAFAGGDDVLGALAAPARRSMEDDGLPALL